MAFTVPDYSEAADPIQAVLMQTDLAALVAGLAGVGVLSGLAVTAQGTPDMTVAVASGSIRIGGATVAYAGGNGTISTAHATNPRIDLITLSNAGSLTVTAGTAAAAPVAPDIPSNHVLLAMVLVPANDTAIQSTQITDKRVTIGTIGAQTYGTTAEREAASPSQGDIWFDSTLQKVGFYDGTIWRDITNWFDFGTIIGDRFTAADSTSVIGRVTDVGARTWAAFNGGSGTGTITNNEVTFGAAAIVGLNVGQSAYATKFKAVAIPSGAGWYIRHNGGNTANGISLKNDSGTWKWYKDNSLVQSTGIAYSAGQTVKIAVSGSTHTVTIGASSDQYTDSTYTALQYVGCYTNITIDDLVITAS